MKDETKRVKTIMILPRFIDLPPANELVKAKVWLEYRKKCIESFKEQEKELKKKGLKFGLNDFIDEGE